MLDVQSMIMAGRQRIAIAKQQAGIVRWSGSSSNGTRDTVWICVAAAIADRLLWRMCMRMRMRMRMWMWMRVRLLRLMRMLFLTNIHQERLPYKLPLIYIEL